MNRLVYLAGWTERSADPGRARPCLLHRSPGRRSRDRPGVIAAISALALPVLLQRVNRRAALLGLGLTFVIADVLAGLAPDYPAMLGARALLGLGIGGFWAIAVGVGTRLVPERFGPRATSLIFGGISIGTVVGVPAGPLLGHQFGWRAAFFIVAALDLIPVILQAVFLPRLSVAKAVTLRSLGALLRNSRARVALAMTLLTITAQFSAYTFVAPFLQQRTGAGPTLISTLLLVSPQPASWATSPPRQHSPRLCDPRCWACWRHSPCHSCSCPSSDRGRPGRSSSSRSGD
ncbi:MFS transporter [Streptomyces sp. NPDC058466]|uniref:MFS transporter n=1 Tax=Streptomyces sp. NPDC058466 TaxID=3346512 RepID=UPI0036488FC3